GFAGLALFLFLWLSVWRSAGWLRHNAQRITGERWGSELGAMCQVSLVGYAVGGAFLSLAYFDLPYNILVLVVVAKRFIEQDVKAREKVASTPAGIAL